MNVSAGSSEIVCPICGQSSHRVFQKHQYWICDCDSCHHRFTSIEATPQHVVQVYDNAYFNSGGAGYPDYLGESDLLIAHGRRYGNLLRRYLHPGTVLDVGAAAGFILKGLTETGWVGAGVEPNANMVRHAREVLGLDVSVGALEDYKSDTAFDLVSMIQVAAHFYDVHQAFSTAAALTKPGGYWLVETWNRDSFVARMLGQNWHEYSPPSVLHWWTPVTLREVVRQYGFEEVAHGRPEKWLNGSHAKSLVQFKLEKSPLRVLLKLIPDKLPIPYPTFDLFWGLYRRKTV